MARVSSSRAAASVACAAGVVLAVTVAIAIPANATAAAEVGATHSGAAPVDTHGTITDGRRECH